jgi:hypothetical protein
MTTLSQQEWGKATDALFAASQLITEQQDPARNYCI